VHVGGDELVVDALSARTMRALRAKGLVWEPINFMEESAVNGARFIASGRGAAFDAC
jgi:hypothetical protein